MRTIYSMAHILVAMLPLLAAQGQPQPSLNASKPFKAVDFSRRLISEARRLTNTMPNTGTLCKSQCWNNMQKGMIDMVDNMNKNNCVSNACAEDRRRLSSDENPSAVQQKFWGQCGNDDVCTAAKWPVACDGTDITKLQANYMKDNPDLCLMMCDPCQQAILPMPLGECMGFTIDYMCQTMCSDACKNDPAMTSMFEPDPSDAEPVDQPGADQGCSQETSVSGDAMVAGYNMMCMENKEDLTDIFYCTDRAQELHEGGAFRGDSLSTEFPEHCAIDCTTASAVAIKALGCCAAGYVDLMERTGMPPADIRAMEAVISVCSDTPVEICGGTVVPTVFVYGKTTIKGGCPATPEEIKTDEKAISDKLKLSKIKRELTITGCTTTGDCPKGRRLSSDKDLLYKVKLTAATDAELQVKQHALESNANFVKADVPGAGGGSSAGSTSSSSTSASPSSTSASPSLTSTSPSSTSTPGTSSCNRKVPVAVFGAVAAWLGPFAL